MRFLNGGGIGDKRIERQAAISADKWIGADQASNLGLDRGTLVVVTVSIDRQAAEPSKSDRHHHFTHAPSSQFVLPDPARPTLNGAITPAQAVRVQVAG